MQSGYFINKMRIGSSTGKRTAANHIIHWNNVAIRISELLLQETRIYTKVSLKKYEKYVHDIIDDTLENLI